MFTSLMIFYFERKMSPVKKHCISALSPVCSYIVQIMLMKITVKISIPVFKGGLSLNLLNLLGLGLDVDSIGLLCVVVIVLVRNS